MASKFSIINFPFFGLNKQPKEVNITNEQIKIKTFDNLNQIAFDSSVKWPGNYFAHLIQMDSLNMNRIKFDYTALNIQHLVMKKNLEWGIDNHSTIHNLRKKQEFPAIQSPISKTAKGLLWFKHVSYPFEIPFNIEQTLSTYHIGTLIYIDKVWYIYELTSQYKKLDTIWL
jgi:hypothetical protein